MPGIGEWFWILSDFRELSFCGPCIFFKIFDINAYAYPISLIADDS